MKKSIKERRLLSLLSWLVAASLAFIIPVSSAFAFNRIDVIRAMESIDSNWNELQMDVWINDLKNEPDPGVFIGDSMRFSVESSAPGYFLFVLVDAKGETTVINSHTGQPPSTNLDYPPEDSVDVLDQGPPAGEQTLFVVASDTPFSNESLGMSDYIDTVAKDSTILAGFVAAVSQVSATGKLAISPRYKYFVDSTDNKISSRGLWKVVRQQIKEANTDPDSGGDPVNIIEGGTGDKTTAAVEPVTTGSATASASSALALDIKFQFNSSDLEAEGITQLDVLGSTLVTLMEEETLPRISLEGHTDDIGSAEYNKFLSNKRAEAARDYLLDTFGLPQSTIEAYGMGEEFPVSDNVTKAARALNRRVELRVLR